MAEKKAKAQEAPKDEQPEQDIAVDDSIVGKNIDERMKMLERDLKRMGAR